MSGNILEVTTDVRMLRLADILGAVSYALDLTEGQPPGHCLRCCWIGMKLGGALGLEASALSDLYYTLLLKDAGCSSNAGRLWELYGGDERLVKHDFKTVDSQSFVQVARFVLNHTGPGERLGARLHRLLHLSRHGEELATELIRTRCERGADIALQLGFSEAVACGIRALDEHWNGQGKPAGLSGEAIPINARIALLAQVADVFHAESGTDAALREVLQRCGSWFDPALVKIFQKMFEEPSFWPLSHLPDLEAKVAALEPEACQIMIDEARLDTLAEAFARVVDAKSSFTYGHSQRVALYTDAVASALGLSGVRRRWLRRGALLHDIGKLGVSNAILDKPGRLDAEEWAHVQKHAQLSEEILSRLGCLSDIAPIAAAHHERLDGQGYPKGLSGDAIALETRIITVADIFDAITAARPYRGPIPIPEALEIMEKERGSAIDGRCLDALRACLPALSLEGLD